MSGTVDASIPLQAKVPQQPNPLQMIGQFATLQNTLNQNKLFPGQLQLQGQQVQSGQANLTQLHNQLAAQILSPLLGSPDLVTIPKMAGLLGAGENSGVITQPFLSRLASIPLTGDPKADDKAFRQTIAASLQSPENAVGAVAPQQFDIDRGPSIQPYLGGAKGMPDQGVLQPTGNPIGKGPGPQFVSTGGGSVATNNGQPVAPVIPNTPTPSEMNDLKPVFNEETRKLELKPRTEIAPMVGGTGQPVPGLPSTARPGKAAVSSMPVDTAGEVEASILHAGAARERANNYQNTIFPIEGAIKTLATADTGKGGEILNNIRGVIGDTPLRYVAAFLPDSLSDQEKRAAYDEANKFTTNIALNAPGGSRSNQGQETAAAASPNLHISNTAALAIAKSVLAQKRMEQAATIAFNQSGKPAGDYDKFTNNFVTTQDPRAYAVDMMNKDERSKLFQSLGGDKQSKEYQKFKSSVQNGINTMVITPPGGG